MHILAANTNWGEVAAIASIVSLFLVAFFTFLLNRRQTSGKVKTTDAATLWASSEKLLKIYQEDNTAMRAEITGLQDEMKRLRLEVQSWHDDSQGWHDEAIALRRELSRWRPAVNPNPNPSVNPSVNPNPSANQTFDDDPDPRQERRAPNPNNLHRLADNELGLDIAHRRIDNPRDPNPNG